MKLQDKFDRRINIAKEHISGATLDELAAKYGLSRSYVYQIVTAYRAFYGPAPVVAPASVPKVKISKLEQAKNNAELDGRWLAWKADHFRMCDDLQSGECCLSCHGNDDLHFILVDGMYYYICCWRYRDNWEKRGFKNPYSNISLCP